MSALYLTQGRLDAAPQMRAEPLLLALLWLTGFGGAFVFMEPSPYEIIGTLTIAVFAIAGLSLRPTLIPLIALLMLCNIGYAIAVIPLIGQDKPVIWVFVSIFMAATAIFFAMMLGTNTERRLDVLMRGYLAAGVIASVAALLGYFHVLGSLSEMFLRYERARGTFNDPNVLGAFLVLPALLLVQRIISGRFAVALGSSALLLLFVGAMLLSFSRAAWGQLAFCCVLLMAVTFLTSRSTNERLRIVVISIGGGLVLMAFIAALLSVGQVADLFKERASLDQSYDLGYLGRFGRYTLGASLALDRPFGIGPLQFTTIFPEDPHNTFLNSFMSGGWLAGIGYPTLTIISIVSGLRYIAMETPWRSAYQVVYIAYLGTVFESAIIDIDHWRHYFLLLGVLWGLIAASRAYETRAIRLHPSPAH